LVAPPGDHGTSEHHLDAAGNIRSSPPDTANTPMQGSASMDLLPPASSSTPTNADDHAAHHPASEGDALSAKATSMSGMMETMMGGCQGGECGRDMRINKLLYPQLMALPDLPAERRIHVEHLAQSRIHDGIRKLLFLSTATALQHSDYVELQKASDELRIAWREFDSGLSAHRALAEGQAPDLIAMAWFRREMRLADPMAETLPHGIFGLSGFHYLTMALLLVFAILASWMYVERLRRTNEVLAVLRTGAPAPPVLPPPTSPVTPSPSSDIAHQSSSNILATRTSATVPTTGSWVGKLRVARIFQETPTVKTFRLMPADGKSELPFRFEPGQFLTVSVPADGGLARRSYSIASSPCCVGWCDLTIKHDSGGLVSGYLHDHVSTGDHIDASGPYGRFTFRGTESDSVVFLAGGVGITPLMSSVRYLTDQSWNGRIDLMYVCRNLDNVIFRDELSLLSQRHPNLHVTIVLSGEAPEAWNGPRGHITAELLRQIPEIRTRRVHLCGPPVMMDGVRNELEKLGIDPESAHCELFHAIREDFRDEG
jgi:glycine betaine catabolism B